MHLTKNKNMKSYITNVGIYKTLSELKFVTWVELKPTLLMTMNPLPSCSNLD